LYERNIA